MLLVIDVGNTLIKFAVYNEDKIVTEFFLETQSCNHEKLKKSLSALKIKPLGAVMSSVVPGVNDTIKKVIEEVYQIDLMIAHVNFHKETIIKLKDQKEIGIDLLAASEGIISLNLFPAIILDIGTAATFTVVTENKEFLGGVIIPGPVTSLRALSCETAQLQMVKFQKPKNVLGRDTEEALLSGSYYGFLGSITKIYQELIKEYKNYKLIITGGGAKDFLSAFPSHIYEPHLVMKGLLSLYKHNKTN